MLQYIEEIDKLLSEYVLSRQAIEAEDYETEIAEKVKKYDILNKTRYNCNPKMSRLFCDFMR